MREADIVYHLKSTPLFGRLPVPEIARIAAVVKELHCPEGDVVVTEGDSDAGMYVILEGEADAQRGGIHLATMRPGELFGEVAIFDGSVRTATVRARSPLHLLRLERHDLLRMMEDHPRIGIGLVQALSRRARELSQRIGGEVKATQSQD